MPSAQFKAILPRKFDYPAMWGVVTAEIQACQKDIVADFQKTTKTWAQEHQPRFMVQGSAAGGTTGQTLISGYQLYGVHKIEFWVGPAAAWNKVGYQIWVWMDQGTKPHLITVKKASALVFQWGGYGSYKPKTRVRVIDSFGGGATGDVVALKHVHHPGTKPRQFSLAIEARWSREFSRRIGAAIARAAERSNHMMR